MKAVRYNRPIGRPSEIGRVFLLETLWKRVRKWATENKKEISSTVIQGVAPL